MTYAQQFVLMNDAGFRGRVTMALAAYSQVVSTEDNAAPKHKMRSTYADNITRAPQEYVEKFIYALACTPAITALGPVDSLDADIDTAIALIFTNRAQGAAI